jgi:hypothetical protein
MWPLRWFKFDDAIQSEEVYVTISPDEEALLMPQEDAVAIAHGQGLNLILEWPEQLTTGPPWCWIGKVALPLRWEHLPGDPPEPDEQLWFEASCGGRDLLTGNGGTFPGRMAAWCPDKRVSYNVSFSEIGQMSQQASYFVAGYLAGSQPGPPPPKDAGGDIEPDDLAAWIASASRFRRTGSWLGRWRTCQTCGCVLLPDSAADRCREHLTRP